MPHKMTVKLTVNARPHDKHVEEKQRLTEAGNN